MSTILVLDDEVRIGRLLTRALGAEGHAVDTAVEGLDGLALAKTGKYDLVLLDLRLPDIDGVSVLRRIMIARPQQPVFVMSAVGTPHARIRCLELGAVDYVAKPFHLQELVLRVRARLRQPPQDTLGRIARAGGVTVDMKLLTADSGAGPVRLSPREFNLLVHLMSRSGQTCTRQELLESVWGFSFDPGTNVVDVCVGRLRAKLGTELIETVRNVGYGFQTA
jgi:DNA-binding response OmpR family regulator